MTNGNASTSAGTRSGSKASWTGSVVRTLTSLRFALLVFLLIAFACVVGTLVPQGSLANSGSDVAKYVVQHPEAQRSMEIFGKLGVTDVYRSAWFAVLLFLLAASLVACTARRLPAVRNRSGRSRWRAIGSMLTHVSFLLILLGAVVRVRVGERGRLAFSVGDTAKSFEVSRTERKQLPFSLHLVKFEIETYDGPGAGSSRNASFSCSAGEVDFGSVILDDSPGRRTGAGRKSHGVGDQMARENSARTG